MRHIVAWPIANSYNINDKEHLESNTYKMAGVVNAWKLYKVKVKNIRIQNRFIGFKLEVVQSLLNADCGYTSSHHCHSMRHESEEIPGGLKGINSMRSVECNAAMSKEQGFARASKKRVNTRCSRSRELFRID